MNRLIVFLAGWLLLVMPATVWGQATEGAVLGSVIDPSGAAVVNAVVTVVNVETGQSRSSATDDVGNYSVVNLPVGTYRLSVEAVGFKRASHRPIPVALKSRVRVDFALEVGDYTQSVEVQADAPILRTDSAETGSIVAREDLLDLPLLDRNFLTLAVLVPGVSGGVSGSRQRELNGAAVSVSGAPAEANNFIIDGVSNNMEFSGAMALVPPVDAIQEFAVQKSQYSAEFGRAGGGVVNIALKAGTNNWRGFAYDYLRNDKLDARSYDFTGTNPAKQPLRRNQFGAGVGFPVIHNRLFLFANYEGLRYPNQALVRQVVPTTAEKGGDFSASGFVVADPAIEAQSKRLPFPGNVIPSSRLEPITARLLSFYPAPNYRDMNPNVRDNFQGTSVRDESRNAFNFRGDWLVTTKDTLMMRYSPTYVARSLGGWLPGERLDARGRMDAGNSGLVYTRVLGPTLVNEGRFGYSKAFYGNELVNTEDPLKDLRIPGAAMNPVADGFPNLTMRNYSSTSMGRPIASFVNPFLLDERNYQVLDTLNWQKGRHALKFGAELAYLTNDRLQSNFPGNVSFNFAGYYTTPTVGQNLETLRTGLPDALLGLANTLSTQYAPPRIRLLSDRYSAFVQDDFRVTHRLTLSMGIRYDVYPPFREANNQASNFDPSTGLVVVPADTRSFVETSLLLPGGELPAKFQYGDVGKVFPSTNFRDFAPRFGFAYLLNSRIVLRGGYGLFYGVTVANLASNFSTQTPFAVTLNLNGELDQPLVVSQGFPIGDSYRILEAPTLAFAYQPTERCDPYSQKYSFNVQINPLRKIAVEAGYAGSRSLAFPLNTRMNYPQPGPGAVQSRRPWTNWGGAAGRMPINDSNYNGLELSLRMREIRGVTVQSAFTYSKTLGYSYGFDAGFPFDPYNNRYDYGRADYDVRRRWVSSVHYTLPALRNLARPLHSVLGDWRMSSIITLQDGSPFSVVVTGQVLNNGLNSNRADALRDPNLPSSERTRERWFDTSAFAVPAIYQWGRQGKNILVGPGLAQVDFSLQKSFPWRERRGFNVRMEAMNFLNRVNVGTPSATLGGVNFGVIRSLQGGARRIQIGARLDF